MFDMSFGAGASAGFGDTSGDGLESMYQEVILDAARNPHGKTHLESTDALAKAELKEETQESAENKESAESAENTESANSSENKKSAEITLNNTHESCAVASGENSALGQSHQFNPTCGDEVTMRVEISNSAELKNPIISSVKWDGHGCSISQASLSMMVDLVEGKSVDEALRLDALFHKLMESRGEGFENEEDEDALEDAMVLQGVSRYPMRIKCALLAWEGLKDSIAKASQNLNPQILGSL
jgi:SUF system feS assembly protein, nifU family